MHAFYLKKENWDLCKLSDNELNHAVKSLRLKQNDSFILFDGEGTEAFCRIEKIDKKSLSFEIIDKIIHTPREHKIILAAAWTKAARRGFLFEKAVELEASELWIWHAEYSQFPLPDINSATVQSWQAQLIAGLKQSHNPFLPTLRIFKNQEDFLEDAKNYDSLHVLTTDEAPDTMAYSANQFPKSGSTIITIGPEGGYSPKEIEIFTKNKAHFFTMGKRILRYETAAVLALGLHFWNNNTNKAN